MTYKQPSKNLSALEQLATLITQYMQPVAHRKDVEAWLSGSTSPPEIEEEGEFEIITEEEELEAEVLTSRKDRVRAAGALPDFIENGLIKTHLTNHFRIVHPVITGYMAGSLLVREGNGNQVSHQASWVGRSQAEYYLANLNSKMDFYFQKWKDGHDDILMRDLLTASRWLRGAQKDSSWASIVMRRLAACLNNENLPLGIKARALSALVVSEIPGINILMRKMLSSPQNDLRQLACLGCGMLRDSGSVEQISALIADPSPNVSRAAILSLVSIANKQAMEEIAQTLLHGDESQQRAAAEALANHPEEGYPTLDEGSRMEDPMVRRAVVYGLARVGQPWAIQILEKLRSKDEQWMVQDAAYQALMIHEGVNPRIPRQLTALNQTPWLIAFAAARGLGVSPGKPGYQLLYQALEEGKAEERLAAIYYLGQKGDADSITPLCQILLDSEREIQEAALISLWYLAAAGFELPVIPINQTKKI